MAASRTIVTTKYNIHLFTSSFHSPTSTHHTRDLNSSNFLSKGRRYSPSSLRFLLCLAHLQCYRTKLYYRVLFPFPPYPPPGLLKDRPQTPNLNETTQGIPSPSTISIPFSFFFHLLVHKQTLFSQCISLSPLLHTLYHYIGGAISEERHASQQTT